MRCCRRIRHEHRSQDDQGRQMAHNEYLCIYCKMTAIRGFAKLKKSKNPRLMWKWVGGSRSHSEFSSLENRPKIALNQY